MALNFKNIQDKLSKLSSKVKVRDSDGSEVEVEIIEDDISEQGEKTRTEQVNVSDLKEKKPLLKPIHILIIILLVLFLLLDDEWLGNNEIPLTTQDSKIDVKNNQNIEPASDMVKTDVIAENDLDVKVNNEEVTPSIEKEVIDPNIEQTENKLVVEKIDIIEPTPENIPEFTETPDMDQVVESINDIEETTDNDVEESSIEDTPINNIDENTENKNLNNASAVSEMSDSEVLEKVNSGGPSEEEAEFNEIQVANEIIEDNGADKLLSQIEQELKQEKILQKDLDYKIKNRPAPLYSIRGPALVRNCIQGHWACIDAPSYKQCKINLEWTKDKGKKTQCYPHEVFATLKDCELAQDKIMEDNLKGLEVCQN